MSEKTCGDCRWFDGEKCNAHEPPVEDNEEACSYFQRKRAKPAAPTAKGWAESDYARRVASIALANGYVKLADDEMIVKQLKTGEVCFGTVNVDQIARKFGYVKLQPGQIVVDGEALKKAFVDSDIEFYVEVEDGLTFDAVIESAIVKLKEARDE